jgi:hypothetical protein
MTTLADMERMICEKQMIHVLHAGKCTAFRSPGYFAHAKDQAGNLQFQFEADTLEGAVRGLVDKIDATRAALPGMTLKMPGMG